MDPSKFITTDEALDKIRSGDVIAVAAYGNEPVKFLRRLHELRDRGVRDVTIWLANPQENYPFLTMEGMEDVISILSIFYGKSLRDIHSTGRVSFVPNNLHSCVDVMMRTRQPNVFVGAVTPEDRFGYVCMSTSQQYELDLLDICQTVMLEVNPALPHIAGTTRIPVEKVHYFLEGDRRVFNSPVYPKTQIQETIADYAASLIHDGDTIQSCASTKGWIETPLDYPSHRAENPAKYAEETNAALIPVDVEHGPGYDWHFRHALILRQGRCAAAGYEKLPEGRRVILMGDETASALKSEYGEGWCSIDLGFPGDRIENVLWRVVEGELEGYGAECVVISAGTHNRGANSADEIAAGLANLVAYVRARAPKAEILVK